MSTLFGFTDPFADLLDMQRQMDRLMSAFTADVPSLLTTTTTTAAPVATMTGVPQPTTAAARARRWSPSLDVWETEQSIVLHAELPGCSLDDIKLSVTGDNRLVLEGHKRTAETMEKKMKEERWVRRERFEGDFYRTLLLPAGVEASQIRADYANGVLEVVVPKPTRERGAKRQTINIREGLGATPQLPKEVEQQPKVEKKRAEEEKTQEEEEEEERVEAQPPLQLENKEEEEKMEQPPLEKMEEVEQPAEEGTQLAKKEEEEKMEQPELKEEERVEAQPPQLEKEAKPTEEARQTIEIKSPAEQPQVEMKEEMKEEERVEAQPPQLEEQEAVERPAEEGTIEIKTPEETTTAEAQPQAEKMEEEEERVEVQPPQQPPQVEMKEEAKKVEEEEELVEAQQPPQVPAEKEVPIEPTEEGKQEPTTAEPEQMKQEPEEEKKPQQQQQQQQQQEEKEGYTPTTQGERSIFIGEGEAH